LTGKVGGWEGVRKRREREGEMKTENEKENGCRKCVSGREIVLVLVAVAVASIVASVAGYFQ